MGKKLIALSDGHGTETYGKRTPTLPNGQLSETGKPYMNENLFNRAVVGYLAEELKGNGYEVLLVAPTDEDTPLETRTKLANSKKADLYVSIHANALNGVFGTHGGIETFVSKSSESKRIGTLIHKEVIKGTPLRDRGVKDGSHLWEIKAPTMPSVLVECGFMDGVNEYHYLLSDAYRRECAEEIAKAICLAYQTPYQQVINKKEESPMNTPTQPQAPTLPTKPATWATDAWTWAKIEGLMDGTRPQATITRQEVAVILHRLSKK